MNNRPIGIFDSGIGGLTIFSAIYKLLPYENYIYFADQKNCPYGNKNTKKILRLAKRCVNFLIKKQVKAIVIACNTVTTSSITRLRCFYPNLPFIGVVPVIKPAVKASRTGHIVVLSTTATQRSLTLKQLIKDNTRKSFVYNIACPDLVNLIESQDINDKQIELLLRDYFKDIVDDRLIDVIATGCTHYPIIKANIIKFFNKGVKFIEPSKAVAKQLMRILDKNDIKTDQKSGKISFYTSGDNLLFDYLVYNLFKFKIKSKTIIL